jgi:hypothetical protein
MKIALLLLSFLLPAQARPFEPHSATAALQLRGGDLGPISSDCLAKTFAGLASLDAVMGGFMPIQAMKYFGVDVMPGSQSEACLHGMGASAATVAVTAFLATSSGFDINEAIAYGLIARLVTVAAMIMTKDPQHTGGVKSAVALTFLTLGINIVMLFNNDSNALTVTKVLSLITAMHGLVLFMKPEPFTKKTVVASAVKGKVQKAATILTPEPNVNALIRLDGWYMILSAAVTGLLAFGVDPLRMVGYTALAFAPMLVPILDLPISRNILGMNMAVLSSLLLVIISCIAVGTL